MSKMKPTVDLGFRPGTYFRPQQLEMYLLSKVKGAEIRKTLRGLFAAGRHEEAKNLLGASGISAEDSRALESLHPMYMGGNYLPDTDEGEVEVARIRIESTTSDVTSVYAKREEGLIRLRVVDEYNGETLVGTTAITVKKPLTLRELVDLFLAAWPLFEVLESSFEDDLEGALRFFRAESDFYDNLDLVCRLRVIEAYRSKSDEWDDDDAV